MRRVAASTQLLARAGFLLAELRRRCRGGARRMSHGRVRPWPSSVNTMTVTRHDHERLARGERRAAGQGQRQGERGGERDDAAHPGPGQDQRVREQAGRPRLAMQLRQRARSAKIQSARTTTSTRLTTRPMPTSRSAATGVERAQEQRHLEAGDDEDDPVQQEGDRLPHRAAGQPGVGAHHVRGAVAEVEAGDDRRDHPGGAEPLGGKEGGVRRQERDRDLDRRVLDARADLAR